MSTTTAQFFKNRNLKTIWLKEQLDAQGEVEVVQAAEGEGQRFVIKRVRGSQIGHEAMLALAGEDEYVRWANWYANQGSKALGSAQQQKAKVDDPKPFDDALPVSEDFNAHMLALNKVMRRAVLREGMSDPEYGEVGSALGLYEEPVYTAIRLFGRELADASSDSSSASSAPP